MAGRRGSSSSSRTGARSSYGRDVGRRTRRPARRRRARDGAPQPGRPSRRHLGRERDVGGGPRRSPSEAGGEAIDETARDGSPYRLRLVAHDPQAYDWYYNVVANPMLWFVQHYLWGLAAAPDVDHGLHHAWARATSPSTAGSPTPSWPSSSASPRRRSSSTTTTSTSRRRSCASGCPSALWRTSSTSRGRSPTTGACCRSRSAARSTKGLLANDVVSFHTAAVAPQLPALAARTSLGAEADLRRRSRSARRPRRRRARAADLGRSGRVRRARRRARPCCSRGGRIEAARPELL